MDEKKQMSNNILNDHQNASASQLLPPNKLNEGHNVFMTNMNSKSIAGSPKRQSSNNNVVGISNVEVLNLNNGVGGVSNSTKVIESLHEQIDAMTSANVQLTLQSQSLLSKLEASQLKEIKLQEQITSLKNENENINQILNRKTRKLKDLETEFNSLFEAHKTLKSENTELNNNFGSISKNESILKQKFEMVENQYKTVCDSHEYYKEKYALEIKTLTTELEEAKKNQIEFYENYQYEHKNLLDSIFKFNNMIKNLNDSNNEFNNSLNERCNDAIEKLDLPNWVTLYTESKALVQTYAQEMNLNIPEKFTSLVRDETLLALESATDKNTHHHSSSINNTIASFNKSHGPLHNNEHGKNSNNQNQIQVIKLRNTSAGSNGANSPTLNNKRSSFYGGTKAIFSPTNSSMPGTLPGVKRSSSIRKLSSRLSSMKIDNTSINTNNNNYNSNSNYNNNHSNHSHKRGGSVSSFNNNNTPNYLHNASPRLSQSHTFSNDGNFKDNSNLNNNNNKNNNSRAPSTGSNYRKKRNSVMFS
ncbi:hypothetical protein TPHA_0A02470 [Tetrapisispora phaffii CBS 4417]|uniref:SWI5-dependent HO expression protein 3 n=1 Tax=Tetrapisispora phaffii (strain ATCC 24235 / CBS 4417 / NBRC 1672 / NRRL Y-8282 / UCD 70-5) TaxID=1071381 RepID=G8BN52_TETPH|nr:hypothetical protein TPHA_0A02470 [Tetrapisispora phaffii CBS 4417]CCE61330.1 hypothetical protein TPHA_0A02470 [Tetrapisispora phaffii CBS 4417]